MNIPYHTLSFRTLLIWIDYWTIFAYTYAHFDFVQQYYKNSGMIHIILDVSAEDVFIYPPPIYIHITKLNTLLHHFYIHTSYVVLSGHILVILLLAIQVLTV